MSRREVCFDARTKRVAEEAGLVIESRHQEQLGNPPHEAGCPYDDTIKSPTRRIKSRPRMTDAWSRCAPIFPRLLPAELLRQSPGTRGPLARGLPRAKESARDNEPKQGSQKNWPPLNFVLVVARAWAALSSASAIIAAAHFCVLGQAPVADAQCRPPFCAQ